MIDCIALVSGSLNCVIVVRPDVIEIFTDWFSGSNVWKRKLSMFMEIVHIGLVIFGNIPISAYCWWWWAERNCKISFNSQYLCGTFFEHISYMYMHLTAVLECNSCKWFLSGLAHCWQQWAATNDNISINTGYFCGAFFGMSLLGI